MRRGFLQPLVDIENIFPRELPLRAGQGIALRFDAEMITQDRPVLFSQKGAYLFVFP